MSIAHLEHLLDIFWCSLQLSVYFLEEDDVSDGTFKTQAMSFTGIQDVSDGIDLLSCLAGP